MSLVTLGRGNAFSMDWLHLNHSRMHGVSDLIDTTEMYLRTIYELVEEGIVDHESMGTELAQRTEAIGTRRALLRGYVDHDGWTWAAVSRDTDAQEEDPEETD